MYRAAPGWKLVHADKSQGELRVMAAITQDPALIEALASGDVYTADAKDIFGLPRHLVKCECKGGCKAPNLHLKKEARHQSKIGHLAFQYGAGLGTFHSQMLESDQTITFRNSMLVFGGMRKKYKRTVEWWFEEQARVLANHCSESRILFTKRSYPRPPPLTEIANFPVQTTLADDMNLSLVMLDEQLNQFGDEAHIIIQFHDAVDVECKPEIVNDVKHVVKVCMEQPRIIEGREYIFPVDLKVGDSWNEV